MKIVQSLHFFFLLLVVCLAVRPLAVCGQTYSWESFVADYLQYVDEMEEESDYLETRYDWLEELEDIHHHPIDLNTAERSDLEQLHFLNDAQIDSLLAHRDRYRGGFRSLGELLTVRSLTYRDRAWLSLLVRIVPLPPSAADSLPARSDSLPYMQPRRFPAADSHRRWYGGTHDVSATMGTPMYERAGFHDYTVDNYLSKMFLGYNFSHTLRYRYSWHRHIMYGATVQQDIGERFGAYGSRPWDFGAAYVYCKSDAERHYDTDRQHRHHTRTVNRYEWAVGDYKVSLGQGLIMGGSSWQQRTSLLTAASQSAPRILPHTGTDESRFLRGAAASVRLGRRALWQLTAFGSWRQLDGTVAGMNRANGYDPHASDTITAWKTDGLHRTLQEVRKRHVATQWLGGGRVGYSNHWLNVGINGVWTHYDKVYWPAPRIYNTHYFRGRDAAAVSADYSLLLRTVTLQGEMALDRRGAYASTVTLRWRPMVSLGVVLQQRSMSEAFISPYGHTIMTNSQIQNEHGLLLGLRYSGLRHWQFSAYADGAYHPAPVYLADAASHRVEGMLQALYHPSSSWTHTLSYRFKSREQNVSNYKQIPGLVSPLLAWRSTHHVRWQTTWSQTRWNVALGTDAACFSSQGTAYDKKAHAITGTTPRYGGLVYARATVSLPSRLRMAGMMSAFHTDDYTARCYAYMPQLRGSVGTSAYYGRGLAGAVMAEWNVWRGLYVACHFSVVKYFDREEISSDVNRIMGSVKNDLTAQVRYRF